MMDEAMNEQVCFIRSLCFYSNRLDTFTFWPYDKKSKCSPEALAKNGFFHPKNGPDDLAQCFVCFKELEGWEPDDDPKDEHRRHSPNCPFLNSKPYEEITAREGLELDLSRYNCFLQQLNTKLLTEAKTSIHDKLDELQTQLGSLFTKRKRGRRAGGTVQDTASETTLDVSVPRTITRSLRSTRSKRSKL
ncbi:unnamed protein product [Calicophoron daubneyi]|uniref:Survivin n=1 Tax=Calicophoron daubneyi TaxID=300641 RepID=A0AAV2TZ83_CALDB